MLKRFINYKECCTDISGQFWISFISIIILITINIIFILFHIDKFSSKYMIVLLPLVVIIIFLMLSMGFLIYDWLLPDVIPKQKIENDEKLYV